MPIQPLKIALAASDKQSTVAVRGYSLLETVMVLALICILSALAVPQLIAERRLTRSVGVTRDILGQLRYARQLAMSERQAITFQYDDNTKEIRIIDHNNDTWNPSSGTAVLADPGYPNTNLPARVVSVIPLAQGGLVASELNFGIPTPATGLPAGAPALPTGPLADGASMTPLSLSGALNITFQANGSVVDPAGIPVTGIPLEEVAPLSKAMFIFNSKAAQGTASAISVLGATGRVKIWRYDLSVNQYVE